MKMLSGNGISEELRSIIKNSNDMFFVKNRDFVYIASSRSYAVDCVRKNGIEEVIGKTDFELFEDQEMAARYRENDEKLFASGKSMIEFREEYPDCEGKKHLCLTTKYLLHDEEGNPTAIFGQYHDIGESVEAGAERLKLLRKANHDAMCMADVNLTRNSFSHVLANGIIKECAEQASNLDEFMMLASNAVFDPDEQSKYRATFRCDRMIERFLCGETRICFEHFSRADANHTYYVETVFDLVQDPVSGEILGICYARNLNSEKLSALLLKGSLAKDYPMAAMVYADTGEYYLYEVERGDYCTHRQDYWGAVKDRLGRAIEDPGELEKVRQNLTAERVLENLEHRDVFTYTFYGTYRNQHCRLETSFRYEDRKHHLIRATLRNITDKSLYRQYKYESEHDSLTGLLNRNTLFRKYREMLENHPDEPFVMIHCDVRHFHLYNTFFGDEAGDRLLVKIADVLRLIEMEYDVIASGRIESDVFSTMFPFDKNLFEKHMEMCQAELKSYSPDFPLELAIGAYWITKEPMSIEAMFSRATIAAKSNKNDLFGMVSVYDEIMDRNLKDTQQITSEMTAAIEEEQFQVYLQPKYSLRSDQMIGAEALVRWQHPERGLVSPGKFIPIFEQNGFIANLDRYMWEHVCQILSRWQKEGREMFPVSVNISRVSMYSRATVPFLISLVQKYEIKPKYLELELTESAYMDDPEDLKRMLKELQNYGFKILMDDFGSGYSSLNTLRDLPVNVLKLDMKFLSATKNDPRANAVLSSVVRMSKLLNLPIVAEGVEIMEQSDYLRSIGCEYVQGFLFARPMPVESYEALLNNGTTAADISEEEPDENAEADVVLEETFLPIGLLEYDKERFAYLKTNRQFLKEFDLIKNLKPASRVFREHMNDESYRILLEAFHASAETKKDSICFLHWQADDGTDRRYHGYVHYHGMIGTYADLAVTFMNVTEVNSFGFM